jgi:hypothetical protein
MVETSEQMVEGAVMSQNEKDEKEQSVIKSESP